MELNPHRCVDLEPRNLLRHPRLVKSEVKLSVRLFTTTSLDHAPASFWLLTSVTTFLVVLVVEFCSDMELSVFAIAKCRVRRVRRGRWRREVFLEASSP
jgi:hypothetical protein